MNMEKTNFEISDDSLSSLFNDNGSLKKSPYEVSKYDPSQFDEE